MSGNIEIDQSKIKNHVNVRVGTKIKIIKNNLSQEVEILQLTKKEESARKRLTNFILCIVVQSQQPILKLKMAC